MFVELPETYAPMLLLLKAVYWGMVCSCSWYISWQAQRLRRLDPVRNNNLYAAHEKQDWTWRSVIYRTSYRPLHMLAVEPILVTFYVSLTYSVLYACM